MSGKPTKECAICGIGFERRRYQPSGLLEAPGKYAARETCSMSCAGKLRARREAEKDPHRVGTRSLVARTCVKCGLLKPGSKFTRGAEDAWSNACFACRSRQIRRQMSPDDRAKSHRAAAARRGSKDTALRPTARHYGDAWTGAELEIVATRDDLTVTELAKMLGRTYSATAQARYAVRTDPRKAHLAGVDEANQSLT